MDIRRHFLVVGLILLLAWIWKKRSRSKKKIDMQKNVIGNFKILFRSDPQKSDHYCYLPKKGSDSSQNHDLIVILGKKIQYFLLALIKGKKN